MPVPPILDIYVVWHPGDEAGRQVFDRLHTHFHSTTYSGLAGGAIEIYPRSAGWRSSGAAPRPLILPGSDALPLAAQLVAVVPVLGARLMRAVQADGDWAAYIRQIAASGSDSVAVLPVPVPGVNLGGSALASVLGARQTAPRDSLDVVGLLERSIAQTVAQLASGSSERIRVFISHTKHLSAAEQALEGPGPLYETVRSVIGTTQLADFFDAHDLQTGGEWARVLDESASTSSLLMVRTDRYAGREWTQREVLMGKRHDVPIVGLIALTEGEERGSFLMDHVPTVPCDLAAPASGIEAALNRLVDEALKRALWTAQSDYIRAQGFDWTPVHAPEPVTAIPWLRRHQTQDSHDDHLWIIHPDPPLGPNEREVAAELCALAGYVDRVDILTPRMFAARGGELPR